MLTPRMIERINRYLLTQDDIDQGIIWKVDFENDFPLTNGANTREIIGRLARANMLFTRASDATVQTSASTLVSSGIGVDGPRVGNNGSGKGLVIEESRSNYNPKARSFLVADGWTNGGAVITGDAMAGPDGSVAADRQQAASGAFGVYRTVLSATSYTTASMWRRSGTGAVASHAWFIVDGANAASNQNNALGATWERSALTIASPGGGVGPISTCDGRTLGAPYNLTAGARDTALDLLQVEVGKFPTEAIITIGAAATRAADGLRVPLKHVVRNGRLGMYLRFVPKGSLANDIGGTFLSTESGENCHLSYSPQFTIGNNTANGSVGIPVASCAPTPWVAGDTVDIWIEAGLGGATVFSYRINGTKIKTTAGATLGYPYGYGASNLWLASYAPGGPRFNASWWLKYSAAYGINRRPYWV